MLSFSGMMLSMAVAILLFTLLIGSVEVTPEVHPAFKSERISTAVHKTADYGTLRSEANA